MKKQFDISMRPQIESGEYKVVTKSGQEVRIVCWDMNTSNGTLLVALMKGIGGEFEKMRSYTLEGKCKSDSEDASLFVITPESELTEFEKACKKMMLEWHEPTEFSIEDEFVREQAKNLAEVARKELLKEYDNTNVDEELIDRMVNTKICLTPGNGWIYREGLRDMYKQFAHLIEDSKRQYDKGYGDCLAKMPMWEKMENQNFKGRMCTDYFLLDNGYKIRLSDLQKLPKPDEQ